MMNGNTTTEKPQMADQNKKHAGRAECAQTIERGIACGQCFHPIRNSYLFFKVNQSDQKRGDGSVSLIAAGIG
jgi:hypothetical protein